MNHAFEQKYQNDMIKVASIPLYLCSVEESVDPIRKHHGVFTVRAGVHIEVKLIFPPHPQALTVTKLTESILRNLSQLECDFASDAAGQRDGHSGSVDNGHCSTQAFFLQLRIAVL